MKKNKQIKEKIKRNAKCKILHEYIGCKMEVLILKGV